MVGRKIMLSYSLFFLILILFLASPVAATFKQWTDVEIKHPIRVNGAVDNSILANITVRNPNNEVIVPFLAMTYNSETKEHNYTVSSGDIELTGTYEYTITATGSGLNKTETFTFEVTPSGETGLLGFYFLAIILSYGLMGFDIYKQDVTITLLGSFALFFLGLYVMFNGLDSYKNYLIDGFSVITLGVAFYVSARAAHETITA